TIGENRISSIRQAPYIHRNDNALGAKTTSGGLNQSWRFMCGCTEQDFFDALAQKTADFLDASDAASIAHGHEALAGKINDLLYSRLKALSGGVDIENDKLVHL